MCAHTCIFTSVSLKVFTEKNDKNYVQWTEMNNGVSPLENLVLRFSSNDLVSFSSGKQSTALKLPPIQSLFESMTSSQGGKSKTEM